MEDITKAKEAKRKAKFYQATTDTENPGIDPEIQSPSVSMQPERGEDVVTDIDLYHGTSEAAARKIRNSGFWNKSDVQLYGPGVYAATSLKEAQRFARWKGRESSAAGGPVNQGEVLHMRVPASELVDLGRFEKGVQAQDSNLQITRMAKANRAQGKSVLIRNIKGGDLVVLDPAFASQYLVDPNG